MTRDSAAVRAAARKTMKAWNEITHYAGFDWARDHHDVVIVDRPGQIVAAFRMQHTLAGWQEFGRQLKPCPALAVAIKNARKANATPAPYAAGASACSRSSGA